MRKPSEVTSDIRFGTGRTCVGRVFMAQSERGLVAVHVLEGAEEADMVADLRKRFPHARLIEDPKVGGSVPALVEKFLSGQPTDPALDLGGTSFQQRVWRALQTVPRGKTWSYSQLAQRAGRPDAVRAVAGAVARNPVAIFVPCHRIVRKDGGLGGYRWGTACKEKLLAREGAGGLCDAIGSDVLPRAETETAKAGR